MGRCVKLVQLNHAAQLDFLLQRLNAMYAAPVVQQEYEDLSASDSTSTGPLQVSLPIDNPPEPEEETEESVEVAIVMADVLKSDQLKKNNKANETEKSQTVVAVLNVGKNETSLEEIKRPFTLAPINGLYRHVIPLDYLSVLKRVSGSLE